MHKALKVVFSKHNREVVLVAQHASAIKRIINSEKRNQLVVAAAGSGKTRLLLDVLASRIERGDINPENDEVIVFTFTNDAADELAVRLTKLFEDRQTLLNRIFIGTIHGWCNAYLKKEGALANTKVIDELEQYQLLLRVYPILSIKDMYKEKNKFQKIEAFVNDLELFYHENLDISDPIIPKRVLRCAQEYTEFIRKQRLLDFGSLIRKAISQLQVCKSKQRYHIFVDEYQDVNLAQVKLIESLLNLHPKSTLFAVGDPRQAIYQWRGSDIRRILDFSSDFKDTEIFSTMQENYRSRTGIVNFANEIARDMDFGSYVGPHFKINDMIPWRKDEALSVIHERGHFSHEERIVRRIKELNSKGVRYSDIAILMRSVVYHASDLMNLLDEEGIPYYSPNKNAGIDFIREFMGSIIKLMELMAEGHEPANRQEEEDLKEEIDQSLKSIIKYCINVKPHSVHVAVQNWYDKLTTPIRSKKGASGAKSYTRFRNEAYNFRGQLFEFCKEIGFTLNEDEFELQEGFSAITQIMRAIEEVYRRRFRRTSIRAPPIEVFLKNLKWQLGHEIERWAEIGMEMLGGGNRVTISTVHAAKGLEWPVVFVPFLWVNRFPVRKSSHETSFPDEIAARYGTTREDEKRLWYVTVTRARDRLYYFSGSTEQRRKPSPFTYSIFVLKNPQHMIEISSLNGSEKLSGVEPHTRETYLNLGVSDFLLLLECPFHFYLRRVKGVDVPVGEEFGAGNVLHKVIERLLSNDYQTDFKEITNQEVYLPLAEHFFEQNVKKSIERKVKSLVESGYMDNVNLSEIPFKILIRNIVVLGIVDAVRTTEKGIEIIDWKSSIHDRFKTRYESQLRTYAAGLRSLGHNVEKGLIYDLDRIHKGYSDSVLEVDISQERIKKLLKKAKSSLQQLEKGIPTIEPNPTSCNACDVRSICRNPFREKE